MEATVTIICGTVLALGQAWIQFRLKQQDNTRDAARAEAAANAEKVKAEAASVAKAVEQKVVAAASVTSEQLEEIHLLVNSRLTSATEKIEALEAELNKLKSNRDKG
jgi:uncharacterized Zn finger protein (UPF0148 family)